MFQGGFLGRVTWTSMHTARPWERPRALSSRSEKLVVGQLTADEYRTLQAAGTFNRVKCPVGYYLARPKQRPERRPEALTLRDQFDLFGTRASDFGGSYRSLVPEKRPRKIPDTRIARQESPKYTCRKSNCPFIGDPEQFERYAMPPLDRSSAIA